MEAKLNGADGFKEATSFESLVLFALRLSGESESSEENTQSAANKTPSKIIQESDYEVRITNVKGSIQEATENRNLLYRPLTCTEVTKMFASNMNLFSKVMSSNNNLQVRNRKGVKTYRGNWPMIANEELDLGDKSEATWKFFVNEELDALVPKTAVEDDVATVKHVMITDDLKFHCKLCNISMETYEDLFSHLYSTLHHGLLVKEERRLDFVYHQNLLLKVKQVRELLAREGDCIVVLSGESYNCMLCDKCFNCEMDLFVHVTNLKHQLLKLKKEKRLNNVYAVVWLLKQNRLRQSGALWQCLVCDVSALMFAEAVMHIKKETHQENLVRKNKEESYETKVQIPEPNFFSNADVGSVLSKVVHENEKCNSSENSRSLEKATNMWSQHFVGENGNAMDELSENELRLISKKDVLMLQDTIFREEYKYLRYMCKGIFFCRLCTTFVSAYGVDYHMCSRFHVEALEERAVTLARLWFVVRLLEQGNFGNVVVDGADPYLFECRLCRMKGLQIDDVVVHVAGEKHMTNLQPGLVQYLKLSEESLMCRVCRIVVPSEEYLSHARSIRHLAAFSEHISKLQLKEKQLKIFCKLPEILHQHEEFFKPVTEMETQCLLCKCNMFLTGDEVWKHINDSYHVSHMNYHLQKMLCNYEMWREDKVVESQNKNVKISQNGTDGDLDHINTDFIQLDDDSSTHLLDSMEETTFDFSIDCKSSIYLILGAIPQHVKTALSSQKNFNKRCVELYDLSDCDVLKTQNCKIVSMLEETFRPVFPDCDVVIFGSRLAGFASHTNDIDVYLDVGSNKLPSHENHMTQKLFVRMGYRLLNSHEDCTNVKDVPYARTPIIRFTYIPLGVDCDLNFVNEMSVQNTKLLRFYSTLDERVKMLILLVRYWAKSTGATKLGTLAKISNYALTLLVVFYLQQLDEPLVPTVEFLQSRYTGKKKLIRGWNCSFLMDHSAIPRNHNTASVAELLYNFFELYGSLNFGQVVLCPQSGKSITRMAFSRLLGRQQAKNSQWEKFRIRSPMCVQDPLDLSHNVTKGVTSKSLSSFQLCCKASAVLASSLCEG